MGGERGGKIRQRVFEEEIKTPRIRAGGGNHHYMNLWVGQEKGGKQNKGKKIIFPNRKANSGEVPPRKVRGRRVQRRGYVGKLAGLPSPLGGKSLEGERGVGPCEEKGKKGKTCRRAVWGNRGPRINFPGRKKDLKKEKPSHSEAMDWKGCNLVSQTGGHSKMAHRKCSQSLGTKEKCRFPGEDKETPSCR